MKRTSILPLLLILCLPAFVFAESDFFVARDGAPTIGFDWKHLGDDERALSEEEKAHQSQDLNYRLGKKISELQEALKTAAIRKALAAANQKSEVMPLAKIEELNEEWVNSDTESPLVTQIVDSECSKVLKQLQSSDDSFAEIFVTDKRGLNVCQTQKTSDYYQADEVWWTKSMEKSDGMPAHGPLAYDKSARLYAFDIYVPVNDPKTGEIIGISKGVIKQSF